ncbi:ABC-type branched-subunit amino acid transport system substrate-binding protein [Rhodococcus percolatus]|uniref:ABC transporter substrate-binding protein n=1 Tax=Rhodococcus opacus TaxID=37919 RepID=UPI0015FB48E3|nr:ABC transporter substrate-binding protein [Rhodococcus opacus]MBA8961864.1 ABC-type branched-subunit amino acid transport system substrate-binding protein [Rhodococcus opacus]MBP2209608.1 ABC-type branched-subunit amino acid transport system substrate-binding protein [Rhodococcus opacus]
MRSVNWTRKRRLAGAAAMVAALLALTGCGGPAGDDSGAVRIGLLANLTGDAAMSFGKPFEQGFELALQEAEPILAESNVSIEVLTEDAKSAVPSAVTGYNKLRQQNVPLVVQDSQSPLGQAVAPLANDDRITLVSGAGSALENSGGFSFRFTDLTTPTVSVGGRLAQEGHKRIGLVVAGDNPSFTTLADATEKGLPTGFASRQEVSSQDTDFSAVLANLRRDQLDAVVLSVLPAQAGNLILQMKHAGEFENVKLVGTVAISGETYTVARDLAQGFEFPQVWAPGGPNPSQFERSYTEKFGVIPTAYGALGYQVGWTTVATVIQAGKSGTVDGSALRDVLPAASTSDLVREHGILGLEMTADGLAISSGVMATFADGGSMVLAGSDG